MQCARQNHASKSQNQTMPSIPLKNQASTEGSIMQHWCNHSETSIYSVTLLLNPKRKKIHVFPWNSVLGKVKLYKCKNVIQKSIRENYTQIPPTRELIVQRSMASLKRKKKAHFSIKLPSGGYHPQRTMT